MKLKIYYADLSCWSKTWPMILSLICIDQKLSHEFIQDVKKTMELTRGHMKIEEAVAAVTDEGVVITDYFKLVKLIEEKGLRLC